jgi:pimeloyl-ACP methyl ester carboxylesterase
MQLDKSQRNKWSRRRLLAAGAMCTVGASLSPGAKAKSFTAKKSQQDCHDATSDLLCIPVPKQAPAREGKMEIPGAKLWYWDTGGTGEAIVLSHAFTGSGAAWLYQQPVFSKAGHRVIGYSRRGYFESESSADLFPPASEDLDRLVKALKIDKFHLLGSAAGATVAADYALSYPQKLHSLIIASSIISPKEKLIADAYPRLAPTNLSDLPPDFRELGASYRAINPEGVRQWLEIEKNARIVGNPAAPFANAVTFEKLASLPIPTLLLSGECDLYMPASLLLLVARLIPAAQVAIIKSAGHSAFWEQPMVFNRVVLDFVGGISKT